MSLAPPNLIPRAIVNTVLAPLIPLLLPGAFGNVEEAQAAAVELLLEYCPGTREELRLAGEVVGFGLQVLDALREAAQPGMPHALMLRLRASATAMRRGEQSARRELEVLQRTRREGIAAARKARQPANSEPTPPAESATARQPAGPTPSSQHPGASSGAVETNPGVDRSHWAEILQAAAEAARLEAIEGDDAEWPYQDEHAAGATDPMAGVMDWTASSMPSEPTMSPDGADPAFGNTFGAAHPDGLRSAALG